MVNIKYANGEKDNDNEGDRGVIVKTGIICAKECNKIKKNTLVSTTPTPNNK
jgi:hypothetical protein